MAKAKLTKTKSVTSNLQNWDDVDKALKSLAECNECIQFQLEAVNKKINAIKIEHVEKIENLSRTKEELIENISLFAENDQEYLRFRKKELQNGNILSEIYIKSKTGVINSLKELGLEKYIVSTEDIDKEAMLDLDNKTLTKCGAGIKVKIEIK